MRKSRARRPTIHLYLLLALGFAGFCLNPALAAPRFDVIVFLSARCPCSASHESVLKDLSERYSSSIRFVGVHANADEPEAESKKHFAAAALPFEILEDNQGRWIEKYPAVKTPHAYLVEKDSGRILYQGGVTGSHHGPSADEHPLEDAIQAVIQGRDVPRARARILGCAIARGKPKP